MILTLLDEEERETWKEGRGGKRDEQERPTRRDEEEGGTRRKEGRGGSSDVEKGAMRRVNK